MLHEKNRLPSAIIASMPASLLSHTSARVLEFDSLLEGSFKGVGIELSQLENGDIEVVSPIPDSPAHKAGIMIGDLLVSFGSHPISRVEDVHAQLGAAAIGDSIMVKLVRGGVAQETSIVVGERAHGGK